MGSMMQFDPNPTFLPMRGSMRESARCSPPEDDLIDYLDAEGFVPEWRRRNGQERRPLRSQRSAVQENRALARRRQGSIDQCQWRLCRPRLLDLPEP
jgi:hypothetical protein